MKNLEQQFSKDLSITPSSNSVKELSDPIPLKLLIDIFSRVPAKSIARFRCVSKLWESILGRSDFMELFLTKSVARPRLLFSFQVNRELFVFSSPQPQNPDDNSCLVATRYKSFPNYTESDYFFGVKTLCGMVYLQRGRKQKPGVICNLATGESITLPKVKATGVGSSYLGFDPISKPLQSVVYDLVTLWNTQYTSCFDVGDWKTFVEDDPRSCTAVLPHCPVYTDAICINGVLYYQAYFPGSSYKIVCFDFRFEKFSLVELDRDMHPRIMMTTLFNYKGKLGARQSKDSALWVLEDAGKDKWSKSECILPPIACQNRIVGMTRAGELVFSSYGDHIWKTSFYLIFYNIERKTCTRVDIQGFDEFKHPFTHVHTSLDFVEDMKII